jgi:hypothetical protein
LVFRATFRYRVARHLPAIHALSRVLLNPPEIENLKEIEHIQYWCALTESTVMRPGEPDDSSQPYANLGEVSKQ